MRIIITDSIEEFNIKAADIVSQQISSNPRTVFGAPTGETPLGLYRELVDRCKAGAIDFSQATCFSLDEYIGISPDHSQSSHYYMHNNFLKHINISEENIFIPNGMTQDIFGECRSYDNMIDSYGGIDFLILGIGQNGHIGFNEPADTFPSSSHLVELKESTINANARFFENKLDVPRYAITVGVKTIMQAKKVLLMAHGNSKTAAMQEALEEDVTPQVPASILQYHHDVTIIADKAAASRLGKE